jgi:hypothetical protein
MTNTELDRLTSEVTRVIAKLEALAKTKQTFSFSHDDGDDGDYEDDSNPSMDASDNGDDDEPDEDDIGKLRKLGPSDREPRYPTDASHAGLHYPEDDLTDALYANDEDNRPGDLDISDHRDWQHHVQRAVDNISNTEHCGKEEAMRRLRARHPQIANSAPVAKRAPTGFDDLVAEQLQKGCSLELAKQRVVNAHGYNAFNNDAGVINKRAWSLGSEFEKRATEVWSTSTLDRCESLRATRLANPSLYKRMQRA